MKKLPITVVAVMVLGTSGPMIGRPLSAQEGAKVEPRLSKKSAVA